MRYLYLNNESYPELRNVHPRWSRTVTWWRAIAHAPRHADFWRFVGGQVLVVIAFVIADRVIVSTLGQGAWEARYTHLVFVVAALGAFCYLLASMGGDMMRRHLRAVSEVARYACPQCGQSLFGHLERADETVRCPECFTHVTCDIFEPPFVVPSHFKVFPPWRRRTASPR